MRALLLFALALALASHPFLAYFSRILFAWTFRDARCADFSLSMSRLMLLGERRSRSFWVNSCTLYWATSKWYSTKEAVCVTSERRRSDHS